MANAKKLTYGKRLENGALDNASVNFIIKEVKGYYTEKEKSFTSKRLLKRQVKNKYVENFISDVKGLSKPIAPPLPGKSKSKRKSRRKGRNKWYENNKRDYLLISGEVEGILHISTLVSSIFTIEDQVALKNYKTNINIELKEFKKKSKNYHTVAKR